MTGYTKPITPIAIFHVLIIALLLFSGCSGTPAPEKITNLLLDDAQDRRILVAMLLVNEPFGFSSPFPGRGRCFNVRQVPGI
jgi:hypothetical protein